MHTVSADSDDRAAMVAAIRNLADFVETRTDLPVPNSVNAQHSLPRAYADNEATVRAVADILGKVPRVDEGYAFVRIDLSPYPLIVSYSVGGRLREDEDIES